MDKQPPASTFYNTYRDTRKDICINRGTPHRTHPPQVKGARSTLIFVKPLLQPDFPGLALDTHRPTSAKTC